MSKSHLKIVTLTITCQLSSVYRKIHALTYSVPMNPARLADRPTARIDKPMIVAVRSLTHLLIRFPMNAGTLNKRPKTTNAVHGTLTLSVGKSTRNRTAPSVHIQSGIIPAQVRISIPSRLLKCHFRLHSMQCRRRIWLRN
jgi:hypothetical protein